MPRRLRRGGKGDKDKKDAELMGKLSSITDRLEVAVERLEDLKDDDDQGDEHGDK